MSGTRTKGVAPGQSQDRLLRSAEVSRRTTVPEGTLRQWRHKGIGPRSFRLGGSVVYRESDIEAWIAAEEQASAAGGTP